MSFFASADAYDRFMGRFSSRLAAPLADLAGVVEGQRVLDVGCGPGALTGELVGRIGAANVAAVDPSEPFVAAARARFPEVDVQVAPAEKLPFEDGAFDAALAQLVVHFMRDPVAGVREMARVTRAGGRVGACVWDHAGGRSPLSAFWRAALELDPSARDESDLPGARRGHLGEILRAAGLSDVDETEIGSEVAHASFDEWWEPFTLGVGPAGAYLNSLDDAGRERLRARCADAVGDGPFTIRATAWAAVGVVR